MLKFNLLNIKYSDTSNCNNFAGVRNDPHFNPDKSRNKGNNTHLISSISNNLSVKPSEEKLKCKKINFSSTQSKPISNNNVEFTEQIKTTVEGKVKTAIRQLYKNKSNVCFDNYLKKGNEDLGKPSEINKSSVNYDVVFPHTSQETDILHFAKRQNSEIRNKSSFLDNFLPKQFEKSFSKKIINYQPSNEIQNFNAKNLGLWDKINLPINKTLFLSKLKDKDKRKILSKSPFIRPNTINKSSTTFNIISHEKVKEYLRRDLNINYEANKQQNSNYSKNNLFAMLEKRIQSNKSSNLNGILNNNYNTNNLVNLDGNMQPIKNNNMKRDKSMFLIKRVLPNAMRPYKFGNENNEDPHLTNQMIGNFQSLAKKKTSKSRSNSKSKSKVNGETCSSEVINVRVGRYALKHKIEQTKDLFSHPLEDTTIPVASKINSTNFDDIYQRKVHCKTSLNIALKQKLDDLKINGKDGETRNEVLLSLKERLLKKNAKKKLIRHFDENKIKELIEGRFYSQSKTKSN